MNTRERIAAVHAAWRAAQEALDREVRGTPGYYGALAAYHNAEYQVHILLTDLETAPEGALR